MQLLYVALLVCNCQTCLSQPVPLKSYNINSTHATLMNRTKGPAADGFTTANITVLLTRQVQPLRSCYNIIVLFGGQINSRRQQQFALHLQILLCPANEKLSSLSEPLVANNPPSSEHATFLARRAVGLNTMHLTVNFSQQGWVPCRVTCVTPYSCGGINKGGELPPAAHTQHCIHCHEAQCLPHSNQVGPALLGDWGKAVPAEPRLPHRTSAACTAAPAMFSLISCVSPSSGRPC